MCVYVNICTYIHRFLGSALSLFPLTSSSLFPGIEKDAVNIFTKYISPDAVKPIPITEQIRNDIVGE